MNIILPNWLIKRVIDRALKKPLDFIYDDDGSLYMERYQLVSWNNWLDWGARLHITRRSDRDPWMHDHPWPNISYVVTNGYWEEMPHPDAARAHLGETKKVFRPEGSIVFRRATSRHRLDLVTVDDNTFDPCISIFITFKWCNPWGFFVDGIKVPYRTYLAGRKNGTYP